jgi:DNA-binding beta-propeller fold protein YncE
VTEAASGGGNFSLYVTNSGNTAPASNSNCYSTVSGFQVSSTTGALTPIDLSSASVGTCAGTPYPANSLPVQGQPWGVAAAAGSSGAYIYVTDTSPNDQVYAFSSASSTGALTLLPYSSSQPGISTGVEPENILALNGSKGAYLDLYVSNFDSGTVSAYTIAPTTGALTPAAGSPYAVGSKPTCMAVDPTGTYFYVTNYISGSVSGFSLGGATGTLTQVPNTPFLVGTTITANNTNYPTCISILPN